MLLERWGENYNMRRLDLIDAIYGKKDLNIFIKNGKLVNVFTGEIYKTNIGILGDRIAYVADFVEGVGKGTVILDADGKYLVPGFIDTHQHSYETHVNMTEYAKILLQHGTTVVSEAFYGMGLVSGVKAVKECLKELRNTPLEVLFFLPIMAYIQNRELGLEPVPNSVTQSDLLEILSWPDCKGLEEPPYIPIIEKDKFFLELFEKAIDSGKIITGHACGCDIRGLNAYAAMGASSDHESTNAKEAIDRLRLGIRMSMREGSGASDVVNITKSITEDKISTNFYMYCGDEVEFLRIVEKGHLDYNIKLTIHSGVNPVDAIRMATINAAEFFKISDNFGSVSPGKIANVVLVDNLYDFNVMNVISKGEIIVKNRKLVKKFIMPKFPDFAYKTMNVKRFINKENIEVKINTNKKKVKINVIGVQDGSLISKKIIKEICVNNNKILPDLEQDILKIIMLDRYDRFESPSVGFINGFNIKKGAIGTTYDPLYENILVVGTNDEDICLAANEIAKMGGGFLAVNNGKVVGKLELPLYGLLSDKKIEEIVPKMRDLYSEIEKMGCKLKKGPFHTLGFMAVCGEIGDLKLSHMGIFDVEKRKVINLIIE